MMWSCEIYCYAYYNYINIHNYNIRRGGIYTSCPPPTEHLIYTQHHCISKVCAHSLAEYSNSLNPQQSIVSPTVALTRARLTYTHDDRGCFLAFASSEDSHSCTSKTRGAASPLHTVGLSACQLSSWCSGCLGYKYTLHMQTDMHDFSGKLTCLAFDSAIMNHDSLHGYSTLWSLTATYIHTIFVPGCGAMYTVNTSTI